MLRDRLAQDLQLLLDIELPFKMYLVEGVQTFICAYWILGHLQYWILLIYLLEYINLQTETWKGGGAWYSVAVSGNMYSYSLLFLFCLNIQNADSKRPEDRMSSLLGLFGQENLPVCTAVLYGIQFRSVIDIDTIQIIMSGFISAHL